MTCEIRRIDAVEVIESERGKIPGASGRDFAGGHVESFEGSAQIGVVVRRLLLHFFKGRKRSGGAKIVGENKIVL